MIDRTPNKAKDWDTEIRYQRRDKWPGDRVFDGRGNEHYDPSVRGYVIHHFYTRVKP